LENKKKKIRLKDERNPKTWYRTAGKGNLYTASRDGNPNFGPLSPNIIAF